MAHGYECRIRFGEGTDPETFRDQVLRALPDEVEPWGKAVGFEVHYSPGHAIRYDVSRRYADRQDGERFTTCGSQTRETV